MFLGPTATATGYRLGKVIQVYEIARENLE